MHNSVEKVENSPSPPSFPPRGTNPPLLGIFAKEPVPGRVKTRLSPPLSLAEAAQVHHLLLQATVTALAPWQPLLFYDGSRAYFSATFPGLPLLPQGSGDLGERMARALLALHEQGQEKALLVGSDAPDLPLSLIAAAAAALESVEVVTIPARDGGYVLIGERGHHPALFREVTWSSAAVLEETRAIVASEHLSYGEIGRWEDVDDATGLQRLLRRAPTLAVSAYAAGLLRNYGIRE